MTTRAKRAGVRTLAHERTSVYLELTKPRITVMVLLTVAFGYVLAPHTAHPWALIHVLIGAALSCSGAGALNQYIERDRDGYQRIALDLGELRQREHELVRESEVGDGVEGPGRRPEHPERVFRHCDGGLRQVASREAPQNLCVARSADQLSPDALRGADYLEREGSRRGSASE